MLSLLNRLLALVGLRLVRRVEVPAKLHIKVD